MSFKNRVLNLITNTCAGIVANSAGLAAQRMTSTSNIGKIQSFAYDKNGSVTGVTVEMADGRIITDCNLSGSRNVGVGSTVVNLSGVLF